MIDIHLCSMRLDNLKNRIKNSTKIKEKNKLLLLKFAADCNSGWGQMKLTPARILKLLSNLKTISELVEKDWDWVTREDIRDILDRIDTDPKKGDWARHDYRIVLRKFMAWLRNEYGYPEGYPQKEELSRLLLVLKYPGEVNKIKVKQPQRQKAGEDIPTEEEMQYLSNASINPRDKAYFEMAREVGTRIGGIGSRQIKHVSFDELGAKVTMHDKTMRDEPVRFITSASYLHIWLDNHPFRNNPEAPLWIDLEKTANGPVPLLYHGFRAMIKRTVERHNKRADTGGFPKITKRIHTHLFRYHAQTRDELEGVPRSIMCKQRGWKTDSKQPERYARIVTKDVDSYYAKKFGINGGEIKEQQKPGRCPRCKELNAPGIGYCFKCGMPLSAKAENVEQQVQKMIEEMLMDPEIHARLREKLLANGGLESKSVGANL
jgi:integrase/recombinase XerD